MTSPDEALPALLMHCNTIYDAMEADSKPEGEYKVWEGFATKLFEDQGLTVPYYTQVMRMLRGMDCLRQLRRGGGTAPSRWALIQKPNMEIFDKASGIPGAYRGNKISQQDQMMRDLSNRVNDLEEIVAGLIENG